jgi:hypothetical protein
MRTLCGARARFIACTIVGIKSPSTQIEAAGVDPDKMEEPSIDRALRHLGQKFGVSKGVIANRLKKDGIWRLP